MRTSRPRRRGRDDPPLRPRSRRLRAALRRRARVRGGMHRAFSHRAAYERSRGAAGERHRGRASVHRAPRAAPQRIVVPGGLRSRPRRGLDRQRRRRLRRLRRRRRGPSPARAGGPGRRRHPFGRAQSGRRVGCRRRPGRWQRRVPRRCHPRGARIDCGGEPPPRLRVGLGQPPLALRGPRRRRHGGRHRPHPRRDRGDDSRGAHTLGPGRLGLRPRGLRHPPHRRRGHRHRPRHAHRRHADPPRRRAVLGRSGHAQWQALRLRGPRHQRRRRARVDPPRAPRAHPSLRLQRDAVSGHQRHRHLRPHRGNDQPELRQHRRAQEPLRRHQPLRAQRAAGRLLAVLRGRHAPQRHDRLGAGVRAARISSPSTSTTAWRPT